MNKPTPSQAERFLLDAEKALADDPLVMAGEAYDYVSQVLESLGYQQAATVFDRIVCKAQSAPRIYVVKEGKEV